MVTTSKNMRTVLFLLSLLYPLHLVWTASPLTPPRSPQATQRSIAQVLNEFDLDNFVSLLCKSGLLELFQGIVSSTEYESLEQKTHFDSSKGDQFTLFAPVNAALPADCRQMLLTNLTSLENLLLYQVLGAGGFTTDNFINNIHPQSVANFSTLQGAQLPITLHKNGSLSIGVNNVSIIQPNLIAFSSVVQITNGLLLPPVLLRDTNISKVCPHVSVPQTSTGPPGS
eukprot:jgi/Galph1/3279/GphlegSOOS_G1921.1